MLHIAKRKWLQYLALTFAAFLISNANGYAQAASEAAGNDVCVTQEAAFEKANAIYEKDHDKSRSFLGSLFKKRYNPTVGLHDEQMKDATDALASCRQSVLNASRAAAENARREAYNARPEVQAQRAAIARANATHNGFVDVATFTSIGWLRSFGVTPWVAIGETDSKTYFYTFTSRDYRTFLSIKTATKGAGNDYILIEFLAGQVDCRPGAGYPQALYLPSLESYRGNGYPMIDGDVDPTNINIPIEHGTVLASAVIGVCDAVRLADGTANVMAGPNTMQ